MSAVPVWGRGRGHRMSPLRAFGLFGEAAGEPASWSPGQSPGHREVCLQGVFDGIWGFGPGTNQAALPPTVSGNVSKEKNP